MKSIFEGSPMIYLQAVILLITFGIAWFDLHTEKIPNRVNLVLLTFTLLIGYYLNANVTNQWLVNMLIILAVAFALQVFGVLGGGDCKYLIALSPIIAYQVLIPILLIAMTFFASVYSMRWLWNRIRSRQVLKPQIAFFGKMPFMWAMIPAILIMNFKV